MEGDAGVSEGAVKVGRVPRQVRAPPGWETRRMPTAIGGSRGVEKMCGKRVEKCSCWLATLRSAVKGHGATANYFSFFFRNRRGMWIRTP